jgi:hypothetical protein
MNLKCLDWLRKWTFNTFVFVFSYEVWNSIPKVYWCEFRLDVDEELFWLLCIEVFLFDRDLLCWWCELFLCDCCWLFWVGFFFSRLLTEMFVLLTVREEKNVNVKRTISSWQNSALQYAHLPRKTFRFFIASAVWTHNCFDKHWIHSKQLPHFTALRKRKTQDNFLLFVPDYRGDKDVFDMNIHHLRKDNLNINNFEQVFQHHKSTRKSDLFNLSKRNFKNVFLKQIQMRRLIIDKW